jgi:hypothetical protein
MASFRTAFNARAVLRSPPHSGATHRPGLAGPLRAGLTKQRFCPLIIEPACSAHLLRTRRQIPSNSPAGGSSFILTSWSGEYSALRRAARSPEGVEILGIFRTIWRRKEGIIEHLVCRSILATAGSRQFRPVYRPFETGGNILGIFPERPQTMACPLSLQRKMTERRPLAMGGKGNNSRIIRFGRHTTPPFDTNERRSDRFGPRWRSRRSQSFVFGTPLKARRPLPDGGKDSRNFRAATGRTSGSRPHAPRARQPYRGTWIEGGRTIRGRPGGNEESVLAAGPRGGPFFLYTSIPAKNFN